MKWQIAALVATAAFWTAGHAQILFEPTSVAFQVADDKCESIRIEATNQTTTAIADAHFRLIDSPQFSIDRNFQDCPASLEPGQTCRVYVRFCPRRQFHTVEGTLLFSGSEQAVPISGTSYRRAVSR